MFYFSELSYEVPKNDSIGTGEFRFYIIPFRSEGVTVRVEVSGGGVLCYVSYNNRNPNGGDYNWELTISEYGDLYVSQIPLGAISQNSMFVAINGTEHTNNFSIISTRRDSTLASEYHCTRLKLALMYFYCDRYDHCILFGNVTVLLLFELIDAFINYTAFLAMISILVIWLLQT